MMPHRSSLKEGHRRIKVKESNMAKQAQTGVMRPQAKESWQPLTVRRGKEWVRFFTGASRRNAALSTS
jgi:hypothetical protein